MSGMIEGGLKAAATNKRLYGDGETKENFYVVIGRKGGRISRGGRFAIDSGFAREMGRKGAKAKYEKQTA